ncbi:protein-export chaperone SecB [Oceanomicrobium pacificus]|uniref:Protein-export protein SecB n=1 Tax=Oceanomicrobium pacificus TaxID=2692916 RepID=A0A6B0U0S1_9RHOB|nr:protein-export chaperone SecB [Oceanomicrobium pacificus]MXU64721.1 protein-export chaperone SecB [Oceanomicrobium pacificus]
MAEENAAQPAQQTPPRMKVLTQYVRDMSFENVAIQKGLKVENNPEISVQVSLDARKLADDQFEVINRVKIESKAGDATVFILELDYAGRFEVQNVPEDQLHPFLLIECPRMIFPYIRRIVSDVTRDGGYPPLNLDSIDYLALYRQELLRRQAQLQEKQADAPVN